MAARKSVASTYRRKKGGKRVMPRGGSPGLNHSRDVPLTSAQRRHFWQLLVCGGIFVLLVASKLLAPQGLGPARETMLHLMEENMDVKAVFSQVGRRLAGENADVLQAVFGPQEEKVEAVTVSPEATEAALKRLHTFYHAEETEPLVIYAEETLPEGVSMHQAILGFAFTSPVVGTLTSPFGYREHPIEGEDAFHYGVDLGANQGTEICAFADGTVNAVGESSSYGKYCILSHENGFATLYAHCDAILASSGAAVKRGEVIAKVGQTGMATGPHLHFEVHQDGVYLNPIYYVS